jgi:hypothetical protein
MKTTLLSKTFKLLFALLLISSYVFSQGNKNYIPNPGIFSENIGTNAFVKGNYLELGINGAGCLVTNAAAPTGYHPNSGTGAVMSMVSDNAKDGWTTGSPVQSGDYFFPGTPFEGFKVEFNGTLYQNITSEGSLGIPGANQPAIDSPTEKKAIWQGATAGLFSIKQTITVGVNNTFATFRIVLKNTSSSTANILYSRVADPDQEHAYSTNFNTINTVVSQYPTNSRSLVKALGLSYGLYFGMISNDPRSKVCYTDPTTWSLKPSQYFSGTGGSYITGTNTADGASAITFNFGNVAPSDSVVFEYGYLTNQSDEDAFTCSPTAVLSGTQTINLGQTANLTLNMTGTAPWSFVMNGQSFTNITTTPYIIPVSPITTTTYTLSSFSSSCGSGTFSGSPTVSVCSSGQIPSGTISGSQVIFAGQVANLSLSLTGSPPWTAVVNGFSINNINISPYTLSASPAATTTYTLTSVSNACGSSSATSSATVSVCSPFTATLSGSQYLVAGQTANLSVSLTGIAPWTIVFNGQTYSNITSSPYIIPVTPTVTTSYTLTRVSNFCGNGTVTGTAVVTICVPPTATLSGNQTINEGENANLIVALTGTSPWSIIVNGTTYSNITTSPYILNVTPAVTTTYTLSSISNACGTYIASSSATVNVAINLNNGLVSCYAFATNAIDGKGKNNGTNNGANLTTDRLDRVSNAYDFSSGAYLSLPTNSTFNNNYTYSTWVRPSNLPAFNETQTVMSVGGTQILMLANNSNTSGVASWYFWGYEQGSLFTSLVTTPVTAANQWYHVVAVRTNTAYKIYVDGVFKAQTLTSNLPFYDVNFQNYIGIRSLVNPFPMNGKIDDVRIYNYAMNDAQVLALNGMSINDNCEALIHNESGLVSCYGFSIDGKDEFANNHATVTGATLAPDRFGNANNAYNFIGNTTNSIQIPNVAPFINPYYTYAAWVKVNTLPSDGVSQWIFGVGEGGVGDQTLYVLNYAGNISFTSHAYANPTGCVTGLRSVNGGVTVQAGRWYHVAVSLSNTTYSMYIDGKLVTSSPSTCTSLIYGTNTIAHIGVRLGYLSPFNGIIDDVRIYNRAITDDEVNSIRFAKGCRTKCPETLAITNTYSSPLQPLRLEANQIVGSNIINPNTEIRYDALQSIIFQPGFKVEQGAVFEAYTNGCGGNK